MKRETDMTQVQSAKVTISWLSSIPPKHRLHYRVIAQDTSEHSISETDSGYLVELVQTSVLIDSVSGSSNRDSTYQITAECHVSELQVEYASGVSSECLQRPEQPTEHI